MTTFDELVSDLESESLLDKWFSSPFDRDFAIAGQQRSVQYEALSQSPAIVQNKRKLDLPKTSVLQSPRISTRIQEVAASPEVTNSRSEIAAPYQNSELPPAYRSRIGNVRKSGRNQGKKGIYCKKCLVKVSPWKFHCPYCKGRVVSNLYYYSLLIFGFAIFAVVVMLIITSKTYR